MDFKGAKNGSRESSWEAAEFQGREDGGLDQEGGSGDGDKCMDVGYIWEERQVP